MKGLHQTTQNYWGNTKNFKQCDQTYAASNGYVSWAYMS